MLWRAPLWHGLAAAFTCLSLGLPTPAGSAAATVCDRRQIQRTVV